MRGPQYAGLVLVGLAIGFREQYVIVLPAFDMVVVLASESITLRGPETDHLHVVRDYVIPAAGG